MTDELKTYREAKQLKLRLAREAAALVQRANLLGRRRAYRAKVAKAKSARNHKAKAKSARGTKDLKGNPWVASWFELGALRKARPRSRPMQQGRGKLLLNKRRKKRLAVAVKDKMKREAAARASRWLESHDAMYAKAGLPLEAIEAKATHRVDKPREHLNRAYLNELLDGQELGLFDRCQIIGKQPWVQLEGEDILAPIVATIVQRELQWDGTTEVSVLHPIMRQYRQQRYWNGQPGGYAL